MLQCEPQSLLLRGALISCGPELRAVRQVALEPAARANAPRIVEQSAALHVCCGCCAWRPSSGRV